MNPARRMTAAAATAVVLATAGGLLTAATAPASAATTCNSPVFKRQFFANTAFSGTAKKTDCDAAIDENWGSGTPTSGLPKDKFGVRWTVTRDFGSGGPFSFAAAAQDGIRVYLDGTRKIDLWKNVTSTVKKTANVTVPSGKHTLRVDYVNWTGKANVKFTYTPRTSATVDKIKPLTPTGTAVSYDSATGRAKLTWSKNKEMDLAGYRVYRRLKGTSFGTAPLRTTASTSYTDTPPATGGTYYYEVRAYDKAGRESAGSADKGVTTVDRTPPAAPFVEMDGCPDLSPYAAPQLVTTAENKADIAWYEMQRLDTATATWITVYTGTKGAICDTTYPSDGSAVTYRGRARDVAGNWSAYSAAAKFTTTDLIPPAPVTGARVEYRSGVPHLVWAPVDGAASYQVLQLDPVTGGWLDALPGKGTTKETDVVPRQLAAVAGTYRYAVRSVDAKGNAAAPAELTLTMADRPEAIPAFATTAGRFDEGVMIEWSSADPWTFDGGPLLTYRITRTDRATGESTEVTGCKPDNSQDLPLTDPETYWTWTTGDAPDYAGSRQINGVCWDVSGASETTYDYTVVTIDPYGHASQPGPAATGTTPDTERPAPVGNLTAEQVPLGVRLSWTPPADDDVTGYAVWQSAGDPDTGETVWERNCWGGESLTPTQILCPTVPDGATHVYRVAALDDSPLYDENDGPEAYHPAGLSVTLPDTRPPGWTGTKVVEDRYPELYVRCGVTIYDLPCGDYTDYRWEKWDAAAGAWTTFATGKVDNPAFHLDTTVHEDRLGLYYYRAVYTDPAGHEEVREQKAYGIWE
ncbi:PA14 domain-containing protein [Streptomyces sp. NPDC088350]|uniref:fibronectin type III domain-containing protein n=1 Tax=Streptomyces sp. NPDC088350 TaxID=3365854 RepID=UPI0037F737E2